MIKHVNAKDAYDAGIKAKKCGFMKVSPYYNQPRADYWWMAGFGGVEFSEAERLQPDFPTQVISAKKAREAGLPVPQDVTEVHLHGGRIKLGE